MKLSRRDFIHAGCTAAVATLAPSVFYAAKAEIDNPASGSSVSADNNNRVTLNVNNASFANIVKGFSFSVPPNLADVNGYPTGKIGFNILANSDFALGYFGDYVWKWSGSGNMQIAEACLIRLTQLNGVNTGGVVSGLSGSSGDTGGNTTISAKSNVRVVLTPGGIIRGMAAGASNGAGGNFIRVQFKTDYVAHFSGVGSIQIVKIKNSVQNGTISGQINSMDIWNYDVVDSSHIDLTTSVTTGSVSVWDAGSPWVSGGEGVTTPRNMHVYLLAGTFTNFTNLIFCATANEAPIANGHIWDPNLIAQTRYLMNHANASFASRGWLRFMDQSQVQGSYESDFANRMPATYISYGSYFAPAWQTTSANGAITNGGSDAYVCADATQSVWYGSSYIDSAIIQGTISTQNNTANPTLNVGGHGAAPVFDHVTNPIIFRFSGPPASAGLDMVFTFSAEWLNGGTPYAFTYTTVAADTVAVSNLNAKLGLALNTDPTLAAARVIVGVGNQGLVMYRRTAEAGVLTVTYTSGPAICTMTKIDPGRLQVGPSTFIYNKILGGWIYKAGGNTVSIPFEAIVQMCNLSGSHCWYTWPIYTQAAFITAVTNFFGDGTTGLTSGLRFGTEVGNELWNFGQAPYFYCLYLGCGMGFYPSGSELQQWSWGALRTLQYADLSKAAWANPGRAARDHYIFQMGRSAEPGIRDNFTINGLKGAALTISNSIYARYGGLAGGLAPADYSKVGNRPADKYITATGMATYWYSDYILETASQINGSVADNGQWLQASKDYANGDTATAFASLVNLFTLQRASGTQQNFTSFARTFASFETVAALFDSTRAANILPNLGIMHYEGGPQVSFNNNLVNGTNGTGPTWYSDLKNKIIALGWNVSAYTISGTNDACELANQCVNMLHGWKHDTDASGNPANTGSYKGMIKTYYYQALVNASAGKGREVKPAQYGYQANIWGLFPQSFTQGNQYTSYDAIHEFNA